MKPSAPCTLPAPRHERGSALLIILTIIGLGAAFLLVSALNKANSQIERDNATYATLAQAKEALLAWTTLPTGAVVGQMPQPDVLDNATEAPWDYDGDRDQGCVYTGWAPGLVLNNNGATLRCLGRLPWRWLGMSIPSPSQNDPVGNMPWYAVSANLIDPCFQASINPDILNSTFPGACATVGVLPYRWLTVRDDKGNILSNRVAAVIIMPGPPIGGQIRPTAPLAGPASYLDSVTVAAGCTAPCVPGTYNNASLNPGTPAGDFIMGKDAKLVAATDPNYTQPYNFNDKLIYITIDELMAALEKRAANEARRALINYYNNSDLVPANRYYPYAANLGYQPDNSCREGVRVGFLPMSNGTCTHPNQTLTGMAAWFTANNWQNFLYYAIADACTFANRGCDSGSFLTVGTIANIHSAVISVGRSLSSANLTTCFPVAPPTYNQNATAIDPDGNRPSANICDYLDNTENTNNDDNYTSTGTALTSSFNDKTIIVAP